MEENVTKNESGNKTVKVLVKRKKTVIKPVVVSKTIVEKKSDTELTNIKKGRKNKSNKKYDKTKSKDSNNKLYSDKKKHINDKGKKSGKKHVKNNSKSNNSVKEKNLDKKIPESKWKNPSLVILQSNNFKNVVMSIPISFGFMGNITGADKKIYVNELFSSMFCKLKLWLNKEEICDPVRFIESNKKKMLLDKNFCEFYSLEKTNNKDIYRIVINLFNIYKYNTTYSCIYDDILQWSVDIDINWKRSYKELFSGENNEILLIDTKADIKCAFNDKLDTHNKLKVFIKEKKIISKLNSKIEYPEKEASDMLNRFPKLTKVVIKAINKDPKTIVVPNVN